jgi:hypothetical protein
MSIGQAKPSTNGSIGQAAAVEHDAHGVDP